MCIDHDPYQTQAPEGRKVYMGPCCQTPVTPLGFKRLLDTVFYIPVAPLVLRCDLPKPRGGERCIRRTKLTPMGAVCNRTGSFAKTLVLSIFPKIRCGSKPHLPVTELSGSKPHRVVRENGYRTPIP